MTASTYAAPSRVSSLQRLALIVGVVGLGLCAVGFSAGREQFFRAWLIAFLFWWGVSLGSLAWMMIHHLSGGQWGVVPDACSRRRAASCPSWRWRSCRWHSG